MNMEYLFQDLIKSIHDANEKLASCSTATLSFDAVYLLSQFYFDWQNTNQLIEDAERLVKENPEQLKELAGTLKEESTKLIENINRIKDIDFISIADKHTSLFYDRFKEAADELNPYWKRYCELNNRLDYLPLDSNEYKETEKECESAKADHDERQKEVQKLYSDYQNEQKKSADIYALKLPYLLALVTKINIIAGSIITDIERIEKEGQL